MYGYRYIFIFLQMTARTFALVCLTTLTAFVLVHTVQGKCSVVNCLVGMMRCSRKADAVGEDYETFGCCDFYFECVKECGLETAT